MKASSAIDVIRQTIGSCFSRPAELQVAALCQREVDGDPEVLLLSSRDTGRWILPKGWPMNGRSLCEAALQEAWEEGGVRGEVGKSPIGSYSYQKVRDGGLAVNCRVEVFPVRDVTLADDFPEAGQRKRQWVSPRKAAKLVAEPELRRLLAAL